MSDIPGPSEGVNRGGIQTAATLTTVALAALALRANITRADELKPQAPNTFQAISGADSEEETARWNRLYQQKKFVFGTEPATFLKENVSRLPRGKALDLAMGEGRNAVALATRGWQVTGVDYSEAAIRKAKQLAAVRKTTIETVTADLRTYSIPPESYDVILDFAYWDPALAPQIRAGLKPGGMALFEISRKDLPNPVELTRAFGPGTTLVWRALPDRTQWLVQKENRR